MNKSVVVKGVDEEIYRSFKGEAAKAGLKMGEATTQAFSLWIQRKASRQTTRLQRLRRASETIDRNRSRLRIDETWDSAEVIRAWRDVRKR